MTQWGIKNVQDYYNSTRNSPKDVYKSELTLLKLIDKKKVKSIYDFGCASGGFYEIFKKLFGKISYFGDDYEAKSIKIAKKKYSADKNFKCRKQGSKNLRIKKKFDLTFTTSVLHHVRNHKSVVKKLFNQSDKYIFFDAPRISFYKNFLGKIDLSERFPKKNKKNKNFVHNFVININEYLNFILKEKQKHIIGEIYIFCEKLPYNPNYLYVKNREIFFMTFLCVKSSSKKKLKIFTSNNKIKKICEEILK
jgi:trans-aconitate methyltransferase